jgi:hypothetical protein
MPALLWVGITGASLEALPKTKVIHNTAGRIPESFPNLNSLCFLERTI